MLVTAVKVESKYCSNVLGVIQIQILNQGGGGGGGCFFFWHEYTSISSFECYPLTF
jgi:hypothetical protein